jgi:hypothetical protein
LYTLQNAIFRCLFGQQMTFCTRWGDELSPLTDSEPSTPLPVVRLPREWCGVGSHGV